jgi:hypothetical protein
MMMERNLGTPMRVLLGLLGAIAFGAGVVTSLTELRLVRQGAPAVPGLVIAGICGLVAVGGAVVMRGAARGRTTVRRPGHRAPII